MSATVVSYVAATHAQNANAAITFPTVAVGDLLVVSLYTYEHSGQDGIPTSFSGDNGSTWTQRGQVSRTPNPYSFAESFTVYTCIAANTGATIFTAVINATGGTYGGMPTGYRIQGHHPTAYTGPYSGAQFNAVTSYPCGTTSTPAQADSLALTFMNVGGGNTAALTAPSGYTNIFTPDYNATWDWWHGAAYKAKATATTESPTWTATNAAQFGSVQVLIIYSSSSATAVAPMVHHYKTQGIA